MKEKDEAQVEMPSGEKFTRTEPTVMLRTSSKQAVVGAAALIPIIQGIQEINFPWPWLEAFTNSDMFAQGLLLLATVILGRFVKSPIQPGPV